MAKKAEKKSAEKKAPKKTAASKATAVKTKVAKKTATSAAKAKKSVAKAAVKDSKSKAGAAGKAAKAAAAPAKKRGASKASASSKGSSSTAAEPKPELTTAQEEALIKLYQAQPKGRGRPPSRDSMIARALELPGAAAIVGKSKAKKKTAAAPAASSGKKTTTTTTASGKKTPAKSASSSSSSSATTKTAAAKKGAAAAKGGVKKKSPLKAAANSAGLVVEALAKASETEPKGAPVPPEKAIAAAVGKTAGKSAAAGKASKGAEATANKAARAKNSASSASATSSKAASSSSSSSSAAEATVASANGALKVSHLVPKSMPGDQYAADLPFNAAYVLTNRPGALANYPHMRKVGPWIYVSGISSRRPDNSWEGVTMHANGTVTTDIKAQTEAVIRNICTILAAAGATKDHIVDMTCFLVNMDTYPGFNEVYNKYFDQETGPSRTTVAVHQLPSEHLLVEIKAVAYLPDAA